MISSKRKQGRCGAGGGDVSVRKGEGGTLSGGKKSGEFDYRLYYRSQKLRCRLRADKMEIISGERPAFQSQLIMFRRFVKEALAFLYQEEDRGFFRQFFSGIRARWTAIYGSCTRMEESPMFWL